MQLLYTVGSPRLPPDNPFQREFPVAILVLMDRILLDRPHVSQELLLLPRGTPEVQLPLLIQARESLLSVCNF